jgi:ferredoxin
MAVRARVDRHKCVGAGNCITLAPTAFDWLAGDFGKTDVVGADSVDEEVLRAAAFACPTAAIVLEDTEELLPWQLRGKTGPARRVMKTFMFTDIVGSTNLVVALGDEAWETMLGWHNTTLREIFTAHEGEEISTTGDGFFVSFDSPELAIAAAIAIQRRLAEHRATHGCDTGRWRLPRQGSPRGVAHRCPRRRRRHRRQRRDGRRGPPYIGGPERGLEGPDGHDRCRQRGVALSRALDTLR